MTGMSRTNYRSSRKSNSTEMRPIHGIRNASLSNSHGVKGRAPGRALSIGSRQSIYFARIGQLEIVCWTTTGAIEEPALQSYSLTAQHRVIHSERSASRSSASWAVSLSPSFVISD